MSTGVIPLKFDCVHCGARLEVPSEYAGQEVPCPVCRKLTRIPQPTLEPAAASLFADKTPGPASALICAICQSPLAADEPRQSCPGCSASYHADCWQENGGCAVYGCAEVPKTEGRTAIEVPVAYWGQENKPCPVCSNQILAAAVRCRHCGTVFKTARPLDSAEFTRAATREAQAPRLRKMIIALFVCCLLPFTAPVGILAMFFFWQSRRDDVQKLPSLYSALAKIGLLVGAVETAGLVVLAVLFTLLHLGR